MQQLLGLTDSFDLLANCSGQQWQVCCDKERLAEKSQSVKFDGGGGGGGGGMNDLLLSRCVAVGFSF